VDTYDTLEGVRRAVEVGARLRERGHKLAGVRIDSGDLAWLSVRVRHILDEAGFADTKVVASNELDEYLIASLKGQGAAIDVWGVGTKLVTGWDQPALGGVYKLSAVCDPAGEWVPRVKVTEQTAKATAPAVQGVRRFRRADKSLAGDMIYDVTHPPEANATMVDPTDPVRRKSFGDSHHCEELLVPIYRSGSLVYEPPPIASVREYAKASYAELDPSITRFLNPHIYPVGLEKGLNDLRLALVLESKGIPPEEAVPSPQAVAEANAVTHRDPRGRE